MTITVHYWNQLRVARGQSEEVLSLSEHATFLDLIQSLSNHEAMREILLDDHGAVQRWILVDRGGTMIRDLATPLVDGDQIELMTHMSGG